MFLYKSILNKIDFLTFNIGYKFVYVASFKGEG